MSVRARPLERREIEARVAAVAARQHGVATFTQLLQAGLSRPAIGRRVRSGRMRALHRGVYQVVPFPLPRGGYMAAVLAAAPAALSHLSAAELWGLHPESDAAVDVSAEGNRGHLAGIRSHRVHLPPTDCTVREGIPVTTPMRTLFDIAPMLSRRELELALARAERSGLVTREALLERLAREKGRRGTRLLSALLPTEPALTRSRAEEKLLELVRQAGLPSPECNVQVGDYELDMLWRQAGLAVEVDGFKYHSLRPRFEGDRRRDARLLATGITVLRLSWRQIAEEGVATVVQLALALSRGQPPR